MTYPQDIGRRPRNATPIPFPSTSQRHPVQQSFSPRSQYSDANYSFYHNSKADIRPTSPSNSEIEVVLDDGTLQRRTISLSTTLDSQFQDYNDIHENDTVQPSLNGMEHYSTNKQMMDRQPLLHSQRHKTNYHSIQPIQEDISDSNDVYDSDSDDIFGDDPIFNNNNSSNNSNNNKIYNQDIKMNETATTTCWHQLIDFLNRMGSWMTFTPQQRTVLKCSFAYFVGSLFTFIPALNELIGHNRVSSHLVATATVFFNPAKTLGGMVEASLYGWGYTLFAVSISLGSMATTDFFIEHQLTSVAHIISLLFWLAGSTFIISFLKAHWNKPPVLTASSLCFIIIFIIVVREGSANKGDFDITRLMQITTAIAIGTLVTVASCIIFWPSSATKKLQCDLEATLTSYKVLLKLLTKTFLLDNDLPEFKANGTLQTAIESHRASFTSLQKSLKEAKLECLWNQQIRGCATEYEQIIKSMERLSQHVGGLRSSCGIQFNYINNKNQHVPIEPSYIQHPPSSIKQGKYTNSVVNSPMATAASDTWSIKAGYRRRQMESEMRRQRSAVAASYVTAPPFSLDKESLEISSPLMNDTINELSTDQQSPLLHSDSFYITNDDASIKGLPNNNQHHDIYNKEEIIEGTLIDYIQTIRRPLKSLAYTCKRTIFHLQLKFSPMAQKSRLNNISPDHYVLKENLLKAIELFEVSQSEAIQHLKLHRDYQHQQQFIVPDNNNFNNNDMIPGEDVFLIYFFVYNMIEFAQELITLVDSVQRLSVARTKKTSLFSFFFSKSDSSKKKVSKKSSLQGFKPNERNMMNTLHTPAPTTQWRKFFIRLWQTFSLFKLQKVRYATKSTIAAILLATPAFLPSTASIFREWRMEWALITLMVVMQPTVGSTNLVAVYRIFSTMLGCFTAMFFYMMFPANIYVLPILTWLFSIPNFWLILHNKHGKFGQFTLLAYNLVMLNKYNDRDTNNIEVWRMAIVRCVAILVGVILGLIATAYVWPYEARVELRKGLSDFILRLAWLYQKLISLHSSTNDANHIDTKSTTTYKKYEDGSIEQKSWSAYQFMELELGLQRTLIDLQTLLAHTPNEPRLKGAFPVSTYSDMLSSCQNIVDKFMSMRTVMFKEEWSIYIQQTFSVTANKERREMVGNVLLYFYLLASALRLKTPLPPYLPPAHMAWKSLIQQLRQDTVTLLSKKNNANHPSLVEKDQLYLFYFAYMLMMEDIIRELDRLGENMTLLFGSLVPSEQWKHLFEDLSPMEQGYDASRLNGLSITSNSL
ncbi:Fusaric acid resistance protein-like-domain-containing protein [Cunninghamella echinulata]|nr:Fusaric acid resistance protein-like-domain-containing protein [Cunninghamella echinulata]